ncbi:hypothetical protein ACRRTK_009381 [Alexandromys fortis]
MTQPAKSFVLFLNFYKCFAYMYINMDHMHAWCPRSAMSDPLELELQMAVSYHVSAENQIQVMHKSRGGLN